jgi:hypothetical protein
MSRNKLRFQHVTQPTKRAPTVSVDLPGGQNRVRQLVLYVAEKCQGARYFGSIKLNKIIWKADFDSFAERGQPVTGREYRRQKYGPVLREMKPLHDDLLKDGLIRIEPRDFGDDIVERRTVALTSADLSMFSEIDISYVDRSIAHYWEKTGMEASDESHGVAWRTRANGDAMPYESSLLSDRPLLPKQMERLIALARRRELTTQ